MTLELMQQTGVSFVGQPIAGTDKALITVAGRNIVILDHSGAQRILPGHSKQVTAVCASYCGSYLASGQNGCVCVWDMSNGQARVIETPGKCANVGFSLSGRFLCVSYEGGATDVYEMDNMGRVGRAGPSGTVDASAGGSGGGGAGGYAAYGDYGANIGGRVTATVNAGNLGPTAELAGSRPWAAWGVDDNIEVLITPADSAVYMHRLLFNRASLEFELATSKIVIPASVGVRRRWTSGAVFGTTAILGTAGGELAFFDLRQNSFSGIQRFCGSPVCAVQCLGHGLLIAGSAGELVSLAGRGFNLKVASEVSLGTELHAVVAIGGIVYAMTRSGSILALRAENCDMRVGPVVPQRPTAPGVRDYAVIAPDGRDSAAIPAGLASRSSTRPDQGPNSISADQGVLPGPKLLIDSLQVSATFPPGPLKSSIFTCGVVVAGTETGFVQVWSPGALRAQMQLSKASACALCTDEASGTVFVAFEDGWVHSLKLTSEFTLEPLVRTAVVAGATGRTGVSGAAGIGGGGRVTQTTVSAMAAQAGRLALGCADGRLFVLDATTLACNFQLTERLGSISRLIFDRVEPTLLHVSAAVPGASIGPAAPGRPQGVLLCLDTSQNCAIIKSRQLPCVAQDVCQVHSGRYELLAICADGVVRVFDFDVDEAVQELLPPQNVQAGPNMAITCQQDGKVVAGGYVQDGDGAVALMVYGERGLEAVGSQLTHGIESLSAKLEADTLVLPGAGGEIAFYRCV